MVVCLKNRFFVGKPLNKHKVIITGVWRNLNNLFSIEFIGHQPKIGSPCAVTSSEEVDSSRFGVSSSSSSSASISLSDVCY
jgi:hypothetical protein